MKNLKSVRLAITLIWSAIVVGLMIGLNFTTLAMAGFMLGVVSTVILIVMLLSVEVADFMEKHSNG